MEFTEPSTSFNDYINWLRWREVCNGILRIDGEIGEGIVTYVLPEIEEIKRNHIRKVTVYISSSGGTVYHSLAIYDSLRSLSKSGSLINTVVIGWAASAAAQLILQAGDIRKSYPNSTFLIHELRSWVYFEIEKNSDLQDKAKWNERLSDLIIEIMAKRCKKTEQEVKKSFERKECWMSANDALKWNLIDEIIE